MNVHSPHNQIHSLEGRALAARLSVCAVSVVLVGAAILGLAARAQAAPVTPALSRTDPASPGLSLTPTVYGSSNGVISSSFPGLRASALNSAEGGASQIQLYPNKDCEGAPFGTASAEEFDKSGIQVEVEPETTTWISANQEDEFEEVSGCSTPISYEHVTELPPEEPPSEGGEGESGGPPAGDGGISAPPEPPRLHTNPGGLSNDLTPLVIGSAPGADTVSLYAVANCGGAPVARVSPGDLAAGVPVRVAPNSLTGFSAISVASGSASDCSKPAYYTQDSTAPHTRITMGPAAKTRRRVAVFRFVDTTGNPPGTKFYCRVNRWRKWRKWRKCKSPMKLRRLRPRKYVFRVKAIDPAGNRDRKPAKRRFKVVRGR